MRINGANHYIGRSTSGTLSSSRSRSTSNTYTTETTVAETLYGTWNVYGTDYSTWFNYSSRTTYSESGAGQVYTVVGTARFTSTHAYLWTYEDGNKNSVLRSEIYIPVGSYDTWRGHSIQSSTSSSSISSSYSCSTSSHNFV